jgi:glutamate decarboxylase
MAPPQVADMYADYPLPPNEEKTEILRVVVRESMSLDLLDRLISDIVAVTQTLMESDIGDLTALQPTATSMEKQYQSQGVDAKHRKKYGSQRPMSEGVHRTVC